MENRLRLPLVDPAAAPPAVARALAANPLSIHRLMAHATGAFRPWLRYSGALLRDLRLDPVLRELVIVRVAALTPGADYARVQHERIASALGATAAQVAGAVAGSGLDGLPALVVRFAEQVVTDARPDDATLAAARSALSDREVVELVCVIGQYMTLGRLMATAGLPAEPPMEQAHLDALIRAGRAASGSAG